MRTIKELLQLVYDYEEKEVCSGLCVAVSELLADEVISISEGNVLFSYIESNKPGNANKTNGWWVTPGDWKPRNEWLLKHINLNK